MRARVASLFISIFFYGNIFAQSTDTTLEVVSWNIEWFGSASNGPTNKNLQEANVVKLLKWMNADLYGLVEVVDTMRMRRVVDQMGNTEFGYVISPFCTQATQPSGNAWLTGQKLAFIYRKSVFSNISTRGMMRNSATANTNWASGRFPFMFSAIATLEGVSKQMNVILIHAKAGSTESDYLKRLGGSQELKDTLDIYYSSANTLIIGDFNDALHNSIYPGASVSSYNPIVMDSTDADHYKSVTMSLGMAGQSSMINYPNVIDNHVISNEVTSVFIKSSPKVVTDVVTQIPDYVTAHNTSDHYPVLTRYDFNGTVVTGLPSIPISAAGVQARPNPVVSDLHVSTRTTHRAMRMRIFNSSGMQVFELERKVWMNGESIRIPMQNLPSGIYILELSTPSFRTQQTLIK